MTKEEEVNWKKSKEFYQYQQDASDTDDVEEIYKSPWSIQRDL